MLEHLDSNVGLKVAPVFGASETSFVVFKEQMSGKQDWRIVFGFIAVLTIPVPPVAMLSAKMVRYCLAMQTKQ